MTSVMRVFQVGYFMALAVGVCLLTVPGNTGAQTKVYRTFPTRPRSRT